MFTDRTLTCADCGQEFTFTSSEQQFYSDRGFSDPRRCSSCRASRKAARGDSGGGGGF
ncbi:MAG: zinc-ribbon domain-containing protein, partial [Candidatus Limnocylindrales bacterium]